MWRTGLFLLVLLLFLAGPVTAGDHSGQVTFAGVPVPGASITATQGQTERKTVADHDGRYRFPELPDGAWTLRVEMLGFATMSREITVASQEGATSSTSSPTSSSASSTSTSSMSWELTLLPFEEIVRGRTVQAAAPGAFAATTPPAATANREPAPTKPGAPGAGNAAAPAAPPPPAVANAEASNPAFGAVDGLLINGSVNNSATSPFAQAAAFGNNRRGGRSLYTGSLGTVLGNSAFDSRPYSFSSQRGAKPSYNDLQFLSTVGGPLRIPGILRNGPNMFVGYQRTIDNNATSQSALMPSLRERIGDFSSTRDALGRSITIVDPATGLPFNGNVIPPDRISSQAASLLNHYPRPNLEGDGRFNYQAPILSSTHQDNVQVRANQALRQRDSLAVTFAYSRTTTEGQNLFGFTDTIRASGLDASATWSHRFSPFVTSRARYQFVRQTSNVVPHFSRRLNVSGEAGISGNDQTPENWGPPGLIFSSGIAGFSGPQFADNNNWTQGATLEILRTQGRHAMTIGGGARRLHNNVLSQQDARGAFGFTGASTGSDFADFLLGLPRTSTIAFGNADKRFRSSAFELYFNDDWRVTPSLTLNVGVRWEYETPISEELGRLANLDVTDGFTAAVPVLATDPTGSLTGREYSTSLLSADRRGIQPRLGMAWRPIAGSSLVVRGGYGIYRNNGLYQSIATLFAQQPPISTALSLESSAANPLTLADGFGGTAALNTFAVDPDFRVSYAHNWQVSAQRDLPASLTILATYLGSAGRNLIQQFLPNTNAPGAANPCPGCPAGFVYLTSSGSSIRHGGQIELRRRLRNGFTSTVRYTLAKATDNASSFTGAALAGSAFAQDWRDLDAEEARSNFDQRHLMTVQVQYTTGIGVSGGALLTGVAGALVKNWTLTAQLTTGSGLPVTPVFLTSVPGTGFTGSVRASLTGADPDDVAEDSYLNPAAYTAPAAGGWGNAARNSVTGPAQFGLNAGITRTFLFGNRFNLDWRIDATNVLNRVTFSGLNMLVGSPQFGLPNRANTMRKIQSTMRLRF
jgi:hypothetical protein